MAVISKAVRLVGNPHRRLKTRKRARNSRRRKLTAKQIKYFGTKAQRSRLRNSHKRRVNPRRKRKTNRNPALLVTLGDAVANPTRRTKVAKKRRRARVARRRVNPHRRRRVRRNPTRVVVVAPRYRRRRARRRVARVGNPYRRRRRVMGRRRRNPGPFGLSGTNAAKAVAGGLIGVAIAKMLPGMAPASLQGGKFMNIVLTGVSAVIAGMAAKKFVDQSFGDAVLFGGLMQTGSVALNTLMPSIGGRFGLGELMSGSYPVPQNPIRAGMAAPPVQARVTMSGLSRAFGTAF